MPSVAQVITFTDNHQHTNQRGNGRTLLRPIFQNLKQGRVAGKSLPGRGVLHTPSLPTTGAGAHRRRRSLAPAELTPRLTVPESPESLAFKIDADPVDWSCTEQVWREHVVPRTGGRVGNGLLYNGLLSHQRSAEIAERTLRVSQFTSRR